jgi:trimethylamine--corrinoid protein Co-methyltransferase
LQSYQAPPLDPGIAEALTDYIARREAEIPAMDSLNQDF